jgi:hypothetical protein
LLLLYPRAHREKFGALMLQHFRDQCRDAANSGARGWMQFASEFGSDFFFSVMQENLSSTNTMIRHLASNPKLPAILLAIATLSGVVAGSLGARGETGLGAALAYFSLTILLLRGITEIFRPANQWLRALVWGGAVFVIYGFIMPVWAKVHIVPPNESPLLVFLLFIGLGSNFIVPIAKAVIALRTRTA